MNENIREASLEELRSMKDNGEILEPKGARDIDMPEGFWDDAKIVQCSKQESSKK